MKLIGQDPAVASTLPTAPPGPPIGLPGSSSIFRDAFRMSQQAEAQRAQDSVPDKPSSNAFTPTQPVQQEPEEVQRMHEEEFERRLKGDYIAAQQRLGSVVRCHVVTMDFPLTRRYTRTWTGRSGSARSDCILPHPPPALPSLTRFCRHSCHHHLCHNGSIPPRPRRRHCTRCCSRRERW